MSKNIVFCADGTWNHPSDPETDDSAHPSNVFKLFVKLEGKDDPGSTRLANEQEKTSQEDGGVVQVAKYLHGVGDSNNFLVRVLGGGFGEGLITRIVRGYTFVSRNYEPGDKIYLVGFSRGAYIARALAGLISAKGLLPPVIASEDDKAEAYRQGSAVWYAWRREALETRRRPLEHLQELVRDLPHFIVERPNGAKLVQAPIEAVAVWDTVGSYGIPEFNDRKQATDTFKFADTTLSDNVNFGRHAVSIDEQRVNFTPSLWDRDPDRIVQVLFPGGHADVGGGYLTTESGLSDCALQWMTRELKQLGMRIGPPVIPEEPNPCGVGHEEWTKPIWRVIGNRSRDIPKAPGLALSQAVLLRLSADAGLLSSPYSPKNIASYFIEKMAAEGVEVIDLNDREP